MISKLNLGFFASHGGSNMQAIFDACKSGKLDAKPCVVISNNSNSFALKRAQMEGIPFYHISHAKFPDELEFENVIINILEEHKVDTIVLAGYMKKLGDRIIEHFHGRVLNIHPALLPKFGGEGMYGEKVHQAVLKSEEKVTGVTIHLVNTKYDNGRILAQREVPVLNGDTSDTLSKRVLELEHILYPETLQKVAEGTILL